jgi:signal transduction histidine kinase
VSAVVGRRTSLAILLTAIAILLPCTAWFVAGSRGVTQEATRMQQAPLLDAQREGQRLTQQLAVRLESLRHSESQRAPRDYQTPDTGLPPQCTYDILVQSPLAQGPTDPLIWSHFQIDEVGELSLPTLVAGLGDLPRDARAAQLAIMEELQCASAYRLASRRHEYGTSQERLVHSSDGVTIVGPFTWNTAWIGDEPCLVALRQVQSTSATVTQGFVILAEALEQQLAGSPFPINVRPGSVASAGEVVLALDEETWSVGLDASEALALAALDATRLKRRFYLTFVGGTLAALLAGGLVVGMVWQSDRLARRRAQFAASAAHELRTPLAGLRLYAEMLSEGFGDPRKRDDYARRIADEADRLGRVVTNMLGYTQLERGNLQLSMTEGDLAHAVRDSVSRLGPAIEAKGARVELALDEGGPGRAVFDQDSVHQILQNLLDNAERYSRNAADRTIRIALEGSDSGPILSVVDRGQGIEPSMRRRLFEPFHRDSRPDAPNGLGIGLSLVQALAAAQNAVVSYAAETGGGSRFTVTFRGS